MSVASLLIPGGGRIRLEVFARRLYHRYRDHGVSRSASSLSFCFLFALFPFLFFLATLTAYVPFVNPSIARLLDEARVVVPHAAMDLIDQHVKGMLATPRPSLLTLGIVTTLYSASRGVDSIREALNLAYDVKESRPLWQTEAIAFGVTIAGAVLLLIGVTALVAGGTAGYWLARQLDIGAVYVFLWSWARWPISIGAVILLGAIGYQFLPDVEQKLRFVTPGSVLATAATLLASFGLGQYAKHFGSYNVAYGAIGGVVLLMTWFYITGLIYLLGGEANAVVQRQADAANRERV